MRVVLFIGHHKVGSSSLQHFLAQNALRLMRHGILYPATEAQGLALALRDAMQGDRDRRPDPLPINAREAHNALAFRMLAEVTDRSVPKFHVGLPASRQMLHAIHMQIEAFRPEAVLLCAEVFSTFGGAAPQLVQTLREAFEPSEFRILCTLRRPDEYLASWHAQRLKFGASLKPLSAGGLPQYLQSVHFDYRRALAPWAETFADQTVSVRSYRDVLAAGGSVADFIDRSGVAFPRRLIATEDRNPSIPLALAEIGRRGNIALSPPAAAALRGALLSVAGHPGLTPNREVEVYGAKVRAQMAEAFAPIHDWLGRFSGNGPFFPDLGDLTEPRPVPEREAMRGALPLLRRLREEGRLDLPDPDAAAFLDTLDPDGP